MGGIWVPVPAALERLDILRDHLEVITAMLIIRSRCEEIGRDFHSVRISLLTWARDIPPAGKRRVDTLGRYAAAGVERVMIGPDSMEVDALETLAADARHAGFAPAK